MKIDVKKNVLPYLPYVFFFLMANKMAEAYRLSEGLNTGKRIMDGINGISGMLSNPLPSFYPRDILIGVLAAAGLWTTLYFKSKNAKKYRKGVEYGSARWGTPEDIKPYVDTNPDNNIILTQTESLTMNSRPKSPKYARNKNVLVIGGSGSGKTRFFIKPNLMQCTSKSYPVSFVVTDPKGVRPDRVR